MTSILISSGLKHLETLREFSSKFPHILVKADNNFDKIIICCKKDILDFLTTSTSSELNHISVYNQFQKRIDLSDELSKSRAQSVYATIFNNIGDPLRTYILTNCYIFYNCGYDAIEVIIDHEEVSKKIQTNGNTTDQSTMHIKGEVFKSFDDKFREERKLGSTKNKKIYGVTSSKKISSKFLKNVLQNSKPFFDLPKNPNCPSQEIFNLRKILYDTKIYSHWPSNCIVATNNVDTLLKFIIELPVKLNSKVNNLIKVQSCNWISYKNILEKFIEKHKKIEKYNGYGRILKSHLRSVISSKKCLFPIPKQIVFSYIANILNKVLPFELFKSNNLKKKFISEVIRIINGTLGETYNWVFLYQIFLRRKSNLTWCVEMQGNKVQNLMIIKTLKFFIICYVFPVLKNTFYITETGSSGYGLRFYKKKDVKEASNKLINALLYYGHIKVLKKCEYDIFSMERKWIDTGIIDIRDWEKKSRIKMNDEAEFIQPVALARFLPKTDFSQKMRIITFIPKQRTKHIQVCVKSVELAKEFEARQLARKKKLLHTKLFLDYIIDNIKFANKRIIGNFELASAWEKAVNLKKMFGKLYFVQADIESAFDSILHDKLIRVLEDSTRKFCSETFKLNRITEWRKRKGRLKQQARLSFSVSPSENSVLIHRREVEKNDNEFSELSVVSFLKIIKQIVTEQRVEINDRIFKVTKGLAQGSAGRFSSQLCEIYYAAMDTTYFNSYMNSDNCVLIRNVDDYLFLSSCEQKTKEFLRIVKSGIKEFNAKFNNNKLKCSLGNDACEFSYFGYIFNIKNMTIKPNYSKYENKNNDNLLCSMKLFDKSENFHYNKNNFLKIKLLNLTSLKLLPILFNENFNDPKTVRKIVYEASVMQSSKVMTLSSYVYPKNEKSDLIVNKILLKNCRKIKNFLLSNSTLSENEITWLFFLAAVKTIEKSSGKFKVLLVLMKYYLQKWEKMFLYSNKINPENYLMSYLGINQKSFILPINT